MRDWVATKEMVSRTLPLQQEMLPQEVYRQQQLSHRSPGTPRLQLEGRSLPVQGGTGLWLPMEACQVTTRCVQCVCMHNYMYMYMYMHVYV